MDLTEMRPETSARHPWEAARAHAITKILERQRTNFASVLDYGCGDGFTGEVVQDAFCVPELVGVDEFLTKADCSIVRRGHGTFERISEPTFLGNRQFDLILLCDILEHVENDLDLLKRLRRMHLAAAGLALVTVPAFQSLFSGHDRFLRHYRRYSLSRLRETLEKADFRIVADGYLFASLLPARLLGKIIESRVPSFTAERKGIGAWQGGTLVTRALTQALQLDNAIMLTLRRWRVTLPGLSAWALCEIS